jgi:uncharacterized protein YjiS (DUF1127 family)
MRYALRLTTLPAAPQTTGLLPVLTARLALWRLRSRTRHQLALLDSRTLVDLGLSPAEQEAEAAKWFWQP